MHVVAQCCAADSYRADSPLLCFSFLPTGIETMNDQKGRSRIEIRLGFSLFLFFPLFFLSLPFLSLLLYLSLSVTMIETPKVVGHRENRQVSLPLQLSLLFFILALFFSLSLGHYDRGHLRWQGTGKTDRSPFP